MSKIEDFLRLPEISSLAVIERLISTLWWHHHHSSGVTIKFSQLTQDNGNAGFAAINKSREKGNLGKHKHTTYNKADDGFKLNPKAIPELDKKFIPLLECKPITTSNSLLQLSDYNNTRDYITKVVLQINASYENSLFDCCAVMLRRLLETLIIEIYEKLGRDNELKGTEGNFMMFSGLLNCLENDKKINLGRNTITALKAFKKLADSSAHNRRYNATKKHIDDIKQDTQLAIAELLQLAFRSS